MTEFDTPRPVTLDVRLPAGHLQVIAEERTTAVVDVQPVKDNESGRRAAAETTVTMQDDTVTVATQEAGRMRRVIHNGPELRITARVPLDGSLVLRLASADARCSGRYAHADVTGASSDVRLDEITGNANVKTASGDVQVAWIGGAANLRSASGELDVGYAHGDLHVQSLSGNVGIDRADGSIEATTASGDITIGTVRSGETALKSSSGDVTVGVAAGTGVWLELSTLSGDTRSDLDINPTAPASPASLRLQVRTLSGDITVRRSRATADPAPSAPAGV